MPENPTPKKPAPKAQRATSKSKCDECDTMVRYIIGCPDGAEICQSCFDQGLH